MELEEGHLSTLSEALKTTEDRWTEHVELQPLFLNCTLDTATEFLYDSVGPLAKSGTRYQ